MSLSATVRVAPRFQRAIRIDTDLEHPLALEGFICPQSGTEVLLSVGRHVAETGQGAFTWTGPYGSGKSSLLVALSSVLSGNAGRRGRAARVIGETAAKQLWELLPPRTKGWRIVPVVGQREDPVKVIGDALISTGLKGRKPPGGWTETTLLEAISRIQSEQPRSSGGLIIIVDEMGKFLERAASEGGDIYLFQQLAELASRSGGRLILICVLHQAFEEYAHQLGREQREEWAKIQGRFIDLLVNIANEEQLDLLSRAIQSSHKSAKPSHAAITVAECISANRRGSRNSLSGTLECCWPLHPVTAALLGPISRRRFGQNQRSLFGFLNSVEARGFQDFLRDSNGKETYTPDMLWDYLRINLEPSILASPDGHRWALAVDAIERCESVGGRAFHITLLKSLALIDLFKERSGLTPNLVILSSCLAGREDKKVVQALDQLVQWSIVIFKKHLGAYAVFAGSDFDIESALSETLEEIRAIDFRGLRTLAGLQPIVAKRHYHETGALRWFDVDLVPLEELKTYPIEKRRQQGAMGAFLVPIPTEPVTPARARAICREALTREDGKYLAVGYSSDANKILELAHELLALARIQEERTELAGDSVARREVLARRADVQAQLERVLGRVLETAVWYYRDLEDRHHTTAELSSLASDLADRWYSSTPCIQSELLNRVQPSSSATAAQNMLLRAMVLKEGEPRLGIEGFPAEGGLFASICEATTLYRKVDEKWKFAEPINDKDDPARVRPLWAAADLFLTGADRGVIEIKEIYDVWQREPYGVKKGLLPVLALAYMLSRRHQIACYRHGVFQTRLSDLDVDYLVQNPSSIQLRWTDLAGVSQKLLVGLADLVREVDPTRSVGVEPLDVARGLVAIYDELEPWTKRTTRLSASASWIRNIFKHASDPHHLLFEDLAALLGNQTGLSTEQEVLAAIQTLRAGLFELRSTYPRMLLSVGALLMRELQTSDSAETLAVLRARAENIRQISGDLRFNAFVTRLALYRGANNEIEGLLSLAANKPPRDWTDSDLDQANLELAKFAQVFVQTEAFARVKGRKDKRHAMAVVVGLNGQPTPVSREFSVAEAEREAVHGVIALVEAALAEADTRQKHLILAALAEVSARYMNEVPRSSSPRRQVDVG